MAMTRAKAQNKIQSAYSDAGGRNAAAMPWDLIFEFFMKFIKDCAAKDVKEIANDRPVALKTVLKRRMKSEFGSLIKNADYSPLADAGVEFAATTSARDLEAIRAA